MSTILAYTTPALGHLFPMTPLLLELRSRGHDVHVWTLGSQLERMRGLGLEASAIDERIGRITHTDYTGKNAKQSLALSVGIFAERAALDGPDLRAAIGAVRPDVLVVDINAWGALNAAEASGLPFVTFSPYTPALNSPGTPPFGPGLPPLSGPWAGSATGSSGRWSWAWRSASCGPPSTSFVPAWGWSPSATPTTSSAGRR